MSSNPLQSKIATPYAKAVFDFSIERNIMHQITADFQNLETFLNETPTLLNYLANPVATKEAKQEILIKTLKSQINSETFKFLMVLVIRDRINLLLAIIDNYLKLVYETASIKIVEVSTASSFTNSQEEILVEKLKKLTNAREIRLIVSQDPNLIGGLLIKTESKILDFTVKNQLQQLAKHLDASLDI